MRLYAGAAEHAAEHMTILASILRKITTASIIAISIQIDSAQELLLGVINLIVFP